MRKSLSTMRTACGRQFTPMAEARGPLAALGSFLTHVDRLGHTLSLWGRYTRHGDESGDYLSTAQAHEPSSQRYDYKQKWAYPGQWESPSCSRPKPNRNPRCC